MSLGGVMFFLTMVLFGIIGTVVYNNLIGLRKQTDRAWSNIEILLKQRFEELPLIIKVIEQYVEYEQSILRHLVESRQSYSRAMSLDTKIQTANEMSAAIHGLVGLAEAYPDLKANQSFMQLQTRISELERQIADRREFFNETVTNYNTRIEQIPDSFVAAFLGYKLKPLYRPPLNEKTQPTLKVKAG